MKNIIVAFGNNHLLGQVITVSISTDAHIAYSTECSLHRSQCSKNTVMPQI